jgi:hypothetical protein
MPTFNEEKLRRIRQFAEYLRLMGLRRHKIVKDTCFIIFNEDPPEDSESPKLKESVAIKVDCLTEGGSASGGPEKADELPHGDESDLPARYIQFAFRRDCFLVELPNNTVFPQEAEQILRHRLGFYWAKDRPDLPWVRGSWKDMVKWEPLQKIYLYRDEESAAEDMAFILFQIWHFPADTPLYVKAATFRTRHRFEHGKRID